MVNKNVVTLGVKDLKLFEITKDDATGTTYGTAVDVPGVKEIQLTLVTDDKTLTGDGVDLDYYSIKTGYDVTFTNAKFSTDVFAIIAGCAATTVTTAGGLSATSIRDTANDIAKNFGLGFIPKVCRGDGFVHRKMFKVAGSMNEDSKEGDYSICSFKGKGLARTSDSAFGEKLIFPSEVTTITMPNVTI